MNYGNFGCFPEKKAVSVCIGIGLEQIVVDSQMAGYNFERIADWGSFVLSDEGCCQNDFETGCCWDSFEIV